MSNLTQIPLAEIQAARQRISGAVPRSPLIRFNGEAGAEIYLKLENLQPIRSFKLRGASNAMLLAGKQKISQGVYTASMGNMAQGVAWNARKLGVPCTVIVPHNAPAAKLNAIEQMGGKLIKVSFEDWWQVLVTSRFEGLSGYFIHPVADPMVMAGHGTIGLEILEELPEVDAIVIPYGGGGLSSGIASAIRALKPDTKIFACEVETAAPLSAALKAGRPESIDYKPSFVEGIGGKSVLPVMWPMVSRLLDGALVVSLAEIAEAIRLLIKNNCVVAEGAGAASLAAALSGQAGSGKIVCIISGGNIDAAKLAVILNGQIP